jgi:hypothetical protein
MNKNQPVTYEHAKLRELAQKLSQAHTGDKQIQWLANALNRIAFGHDANTELGVQKGKGQDEKKQRRHMTNQIAIRWIAGRMHPIDGEKPPKKNIAIREAAEAFNLDEDNLKRACPTLPELKSMVEFDWDSQRPKIKKPRD